MTQQGARDDDDRHPVWDVVLLADEPSVLVLANLCWHLEQGAQEVHLYLDAPQSPSARTITAMVQALPGVRVTECDDRFWQGLNGGRPVLQTRRQTLVATHAYRRSRADWMLNLDADEFLWMPAGQRFGDELADAAGHGAYLALPTRERAYVRGPVRALFEGVFRGPLPRRDPVPPDLANQEPFIARGVSGHAAGKACTRTGLRAVLRPHAPRVDGALPPSRPARNAVMLHFDGLTPLHWMLKLRRYGAHDPAHWSRFLAEHRRAQVAFARDHGNDARALRELHDRLKSVADPAAMQAAGLVRAYEFDPAPALARWLGKPLDLSADAFDDALRLAYPDLAHDL
ncbi:MAG: Glycosyl transferase family 2 [Rhodobacteraceae bacterium HLUCCA12]|nr:MAG: Glycosyl transferase family 2 [Rhodobacteraceae bacterium HLUCCA12]